MNLEHRIWSHEVLPLHHPCIWWQWRDLHPHIPGYEPGALLIKLAIAPKAEVRFVDAFAKSLVEKRLPEGYSRCRFCRPMPSTTWLLSHLGASTGVAPPSLCLRGTATYLVVYKAHGSNENRTRNLSLDKRSL